MNTTKFTAITCNKARRLFGADKNLRPYGYTLMVSPPIEHTIEGNDVEGIGWVPYNPPKKVIERWQGWYKHKADAVARASELTLSYGRLDRSNSSTILPS